MRLAVVLALAACGGTQTPATTNPDEPRGVVKDTRSEIEKRRDVACELVAKKLTQCAFDDLKAMLAKGEISQKVYEENSTPDVQRLHTQKYMESCTQPKSSRQVRVLEVCYREETGCDPLSECLTNIQPEAAK